jgi:proteasome lid subunit RPN8/RPN11
MLARNPEPMYRMFLEFYETAGGPHIHEEPLCVTDFDRARLAANWAGFQSGLLPDYSPGREPCHIEPIFADPGGGSPRATGFTVNIATAGGDVHRVSFDLDHFRIRARQTASELLRLGRLNGAKSLLYGLTASPAWNGDTELGGAAFTLEEAVTAVAIRPASRESFGPEEPWDSPQADEYPVLIHRHVIDDALAEAAGAPDRETGGFLLGHLRFDSTSRRPFLEVTNLVRAQSTEASITSLTFTPESWAHARRLIEIRGEGEILAGWMHSHPFQFCAECPIPAPPECIAKILFFSRDDEFVMEAAFPQPYMVGLLAGVEPRLEAAIGHKPVRLFGWDRGVIRARGFHVIGD